MFQFLTITQAGCRRSFPRHLLHRITTLTISGVAALIAQVIYTQPVNAKSSDRPNIVLIMADDNDELPKEVGQKDAKTWQNASHSRFSKPLRIMANRGRFRAINYT